ncbi:unnamed protein product [Linum tenue]|uniref:Uncharacterized protein n=1 Tax=Linum tenue TaxID=586396 RepID=A0AAV0J7Q7_9ROSI|nr:unnamed protein product [Linum tenue]
MSYHSSLHISFFSFSSKLSSLGSKKKKVLTLLHDLLLLMSHDHMSSFVRYLQVLYHTSVPAIEIP